MATWIGLQMFTKLREVRTCGFDVLIISYEKNPARLTHIFAPQEQVNKYTMPLSNRFGCLSLYLKISLILLKASIYLSCTLPHLILLKQELILALILAELSPINGSLIKTLNLSGLYWSCGSVLEYCLTKKL